jgi:hypothetical protein
MNPTRHYKAISDYGSRHIDDVVIDLRRDGAKAYRDGDLIVTDALLPLAKTSVPNSRIHFRLIKSNPGSRALLSLRGRNPKMRRGLTDRYYRSAFRDRGLTNSEVKTALRMMDEGVGTMVGMVDRTGFIARLVKDKRTKQNPRRTPHSSPFYAYEKARERESASLEAERQRRNRKLLADLRADARFELMKTGVKTRAEAMLERMKRKRNPRHYLSSEHRSVCVDDEEVPVGVPHLSSCRDFARNPPRYSPAVLRTSQGGKTRIDVPGFVATIAPEEHVSYCRDFARNPKLPARYFKTPQFKGRKEIRTYRGVAYYRVRKPDGRLAWVTIPEREARNPGMPKSVIHAALKKGYGLSRSSTGLYQIKKPGTGEPLFHTLTTAKGVRAHLKMLPSLRARNPELLIQNAFANPRRSTMKRRKKRKGGKTIKYQGKRMYFLQLYNKYGATRARRIWNRHKGRGASATKRLTHRRRRRGRK